MTPHDTDLTPFRPYEALVRDVLRQDVHRLGQRREPALRGKVFHNPTGFRVTQFAESCSAKSSGSHPGGGSEQDGRGDFITPPADYWRLVFWPGEVRHRRPGQGAPGSGIDPAPGTCLGHEELSERKLSSPMSCDKP